MRKTGQTPGSDQPAGSNRTPEGEIDWAEVVKRVGPRLVGYFRRRGLLVAVQEVDDALSESIYYLHTIEYRFDPRRGDSESWLFVTARNRIFNILKKNKARREISTDLDKLRIYPQDSEVDESSDSKSEVHRALIEVLESLSDSDRSFILDYAGNPGSKKGSDRVRAYRIRAKIEGAMRRKGYGDAIPALRQKGGHDER